MNMQQVWQAQAIEAPRISLPYVQLRARTLETRTRWRNGVEYVLCFLAVCWYAWVGFKYLADKPLMLAALVYGGVFALYWVYRWHRLAGAEAMPADAGVIDTLTFQRRQLEKQRDARRISWRWWAAGIVPLGFFLASYALEYEVVKWKPIVMGVLLSVVTMAVYIWHYERSANALQAEIDALDSLSGPAGKS
jgi:hypothetical protein